MDGLKNVRGFETRTMLRLESRLHCPGDPVSRRRALLEGLCELVQGDAGVCAVFCRATPGDPPTIVSTTEFRTNSARDLVLSTTPLSLAGIDKDDWRVQHAVDIPEADSSALLAIYRHPQRGLKFRLRHRKLIQLFMDETISLYRADMQPGDGERDALSPRERQTLQCLLEGLGEKQIASRLQISMHTVHHYAKAIHRHFKVSSRSELLARWVGTSVQMPIRESHEPAIAVPK